MDFKVDTYLHYFFIIIEYHANRIIPEKLFNSDLHPLMKYEDNKIVLQGNGGVKSFMI